MWFRGSIDGAGGCPGHGADDSQSWIDTYSNPNKGVTREWVEAKVAPRSTPENMERLARLIADTDPVRGANYVAVSDGAVIGMCPYCDRTGRCNVGAIMWTRHGTARVSGPR